MTVLPSECLVQEIEHSEIQYMLDRMSAMQSMEGNPEGIEVKHFGMTVCLYSEHMPWAMFNTVKGMTSADAKYLDDIIAFYQVRGRAVQFEIVPSRADRNLLKSLAERGLYSSGFHNSLYTVPGDSEERLPESIVIRELQQDEFQLYATIHCKGTGLSENGIPYIAANNQILHSRRGWKYFLAYCDMEPAAVGVMYMQEGAASLTFAATLPEYRGRGLQQALIRRRIREAAVQGCRLVVGQCAFLSQSHRNMERAGMKLGYVRSTWIKQE
ncbi:GNAT family N-acetyltransferase [Paenibacillus sp. J5C_2022]|uniref:GNAT family N-acetyltransferase n=1 Tax=Paenibacillus sp. J5C2022 TaxID=2977129 RepID=UPI0021D0DA0D|nr:GNAT family N-acetyltransferase [Paenibacillus sp. J5C2022]MCU6707416.1 GNAT family N-acetyltransferase [Paenibacillus sp. J5C2022]